MQERNPNLEPARLNPDSNADAPQHVGVATVLDAVEGCRFPVSREELMRERGDQTINLTGDRPERLRVLLLRVDSDSFASASDLIQQLKGAL